MTALIIVSLIAVLVAIVVIKGIRKVDQGQVAIIERLGKYHRTLKPGLNVVIPGLDKTKDVRHLNRRWETERVRLEKVEPGTAAPLAPAPPPKRVPDDRIDMREQVLDITEEEGEGVISRDNVVLTVDMVVFYQITDPVKACYEIAQPVQGIVQICRTTMRSIFGEMDLDTSLSSREAVNARLRAALDEATDKWGIWIVRVEIQRIKPPDLLVKEMERQMIAERKRREAVTTAEGMRQAAILKAEGEAEAIWLVQEATARGLDAIRGVLGRPEGVRGLLVIEILKKQQEIAAALAAGPNSKFYLPTSLAGLYGAVDGIKEMLKLHDSIGGAPPTS